MKLRSLRYGTLLVVVLCTVSVMAEEAASAGPRNESRTVTAQPARNAEATEAGTAAVEQKFEYPRLAARQERSAKRNPGKVQANNPCVGCRCNYICNDFGYCNLTVSSSCRMVQPECEDCGLCFCY